MCVTHGWFRFDYSHDITEILLKVALNTITHNHSSDYSLLITRGSTFIEILVSLQKKAINIVNILCATDDDIKRTAITKWTVKPWLPRGHVHILVIGCSHHVSGVMLVSVVDRWSEPRSSQTKTMKLVFVASPPSTQY